MQPKSHYEARREARRRRNDKGDTCDITELLALGAGELERTEVPQDEVAISYTSLELVLYSTYSESAPAGSNAHTHYVIVRQPALVHP